MTRSRSILPRCVAALLLFVSACKDDPTSPEHFTVSLSALNLTRLESGQGHYELWISFPEGHSSNLAKRNHGDEAYVSFGKFNLSADNTQLLSLAGQAMSFTPHHEVDINLALDAIVTIELEGDQDDELGSRILAGGFSGSDREANAYLSTGAEDAFDYDYRAATAAYVLTTPTTNDSTDFRSGIWWIKSSSSISAGIDKLPVLADTSGWRYEGWLIDRANSRAYSTGKFLSSAAADADRAGTTAGADGVDQDGDGRGDGFAFPGQDFIQSSNGVPAFLQLDNGSFEARLTLEPEPDNSSAPFFLTLLTDVTIGPSLSRNHSPQSMDNRASAFPSATVTIKR